ncbi:hypothetical protein [Flexivirga caeni]|nr:hypothetical protein [Flexivirga caeni]
MTPWGGFDLAKKRIETGLLLDFAREATCGVFAEHRRERGREVGADNLLVVDVQVLEDGLVQMASLVLVGGQVLLVSLGQ